MGRGLGLRLCCAASLFGVKIDTGVRSLAARWAGKVDSGAPSQLHIRAARHVSAGMARSNELSFIPSFLLPLPRRLLLQLGRLLFQDKLRGRCR